MDRKEYMQVYQKEWRLKNPEKQSQYYAKCDKKRREDDPLYYVKKIFRERKRVAKTKGIPFTITLDDIKDVPSHCPILGIPLISGKGSNNPNAASLDKIIPSLGYVPGNVCWVSFRANRIKCDASIEEINMLLAWMKQHELCSA